MTLITEVLKRCARQCSIDEPSSWLTATDEDQVALRDDFLLETVDDLLDRLDLPFPISAQTTITGDGSETYSLPSSFRRLHRDPMAVYETTTNRRACIPVTDDGRWTHIKELGTAGAERYFRLAGYDGNHSISFYQSPTSGISITVSYVTNNWKATSSGTAGSTFTDSEDVLLLPRRVVEVGVVYRFRERNGLNAQAKRLEYEALVNRLSNDSRARRSINFGEPAARTRPWDVPVPDYIPPVS